MLKPEANISPKVSCIINPFAANKKWKRNILVRRYIQKNLPGHYIDTQKDKEFTIQAARRLSAESDIIVAAGGDGTIADVIQGILDSGQNKETIFGIIPLGSGNAFRISMGIPLTISRALDILKQGKTKEIDLINLGGKVATFGSIGATAQVLVEKLRYKIPGFLGHILASRIMLNLSQKEQEIEMYDGIDDAGTKFDRKILRLKVFDAYIGKTNHFGYGWKIAPEAKIDDGYIDITLFEISSLKFLLYFPIIYFGLFQKTQKHFKAKRIIFRGKNLPVQYNGELLGTKDEIELKILPKALKILSPLGN